MTKPEIVRAWCLERIGCPYIYGGTGQPCTDCRWNPPLCGGMRKVYAEIALKGKLKLSGFEMIANDPYCVITIFITIVICVIATAIDCWKKWH